jgi:hypothetical protein
MAVVAFIEPPQGDVIEKILRGHRRAAMVGGLWQPSAPRPPPDVDGLVQELDCDCLEQQQQYYSLNFEQGKAVAATYAIDCRARGDKTTGSHTGTIGARWSHSGSASGVLHPELTPVHKR